MASIFTTFIYTHKSQKGYQQTYGVFCDHLEDSTSPTTEKDIEAIASMCDMFMGNVSASIKCVKYNFVYLGTFGGLGNNDVINIKC